MTRLVRIAASLLSFGIALGQAQAPPGPAQNSNQAPTFKAGGEEVVLDVTVRDKRGHLVRGLKPSDFEILDSGQHRDIKSFRFVEGTEAVEAAGGGGTRKPLDPLRQIRLVTLIFHGLDQNGRTLSRQAALELIKPELGQNVYVSVLAIDHALEAIQRFTNDRTLLKKAIERATSGAHDYADDTAVTLRQLEQLAGPVQGGGDSIDERVGAMSDGSSGGSGASGAPSGGAAADSAMAQIMLRMMNASKQDATTDQARATLYPLLDAVKEQYSLPGRKTILLFSSGFSVPEEVQQTFQNLKSMASRANVSFYTFDTHGLATTSTNGAALTELKGASSAARANVTSRAGVTTAMAQSEDRSINAGRSDSQLNLGILARDTGGELIANTNDFRGPLRRLEEDIETYYEITYSPQIEKYDGTFRRVAVRTTEANYRVQAPVGYFALPASLAMKGEMVASYEVPLLKALEEKPLRHDFGFQATGMHFRNDQGAPTCELVVDVPLGNLTIDKSQAGSEYQGAFAYLAMVKDSGGNVVKKFRNEVPMKITGEKLDSYKAGHFVYAEPFELKPGRYTLEAALLDREGNKISARKSSFMVPVQDNALSISSVAIVRNMKPADQGAKPGDPLRIEKQVVTPSLSPTFRKSSASGLPFYVVVYADKTSEAAPSLQMEFDRDGQVLARIPAELGKPDALGRIQYVATAPIEKFEPGSYQVRFIAKQGNEAAVETTTFTIEQ